MEISLPADAGAGWRHRVEAEHELAIAALAGGTRAVVLHCWLGVVVLL